jgi:hypothetical protein
LGCLLGVDAGPSLELLKHVEDGVRNPARVHEGTVERPLAAPVAPVGAAQPVISGQDPSEERRVAAEQAAEAAGLLPSEPAATRLSARGMPVAQITGLTGVPADRIRRLLGVRAI